MTNNQPKKHLLRWRDMPYALQPAGPAPDRDLAELVSDDDVALSGCSKLDHFAGHVFASLIAKSDEELSPGTLNALAEYAVAASYTLCNVLKSQRDRMQAFREIELQRAREASHDNDQ